MMMMSLRVVEPMIIVIVTATHSNSTAILNPFSFNYYSPSIITSSSSSPYYYYYHHHDHDYYYCYYYYYYYYYYSSPGAS